MFQLNKLPGQRILELGGGDNPHPESDVRVDVRQGTKTSFTQDFEQFPWATIGSDEFDGVIAHFVMEHISFPLIPRFLEEVKRILKPGGKVVMALPNTRKQIEWILEHPEGWDEKGLFVAASELLYGSQDYPANHHKCFFDSATAMQLFQDAGFKNIRVQPYGERQTDLAVEATRSTLAESLNRSLEASRKQTVAFNAIFGEHRDGGIAVEEPPVKPVDDANPSRPEPAFAPGGFQPGAETTQFRSKERGTQDIADMPPEQKFDKHYFNGGGKVGGYAREGLWDYPVHWVTFKKVMERKPTSVLEVGCARGYILKRLQDAGIPGCGLEVSKHCYMTRVAGDIQLHDACKTPWPFPFPLQKNPVTGNDIWQRDLCYSAATLEHIPEQYLPAMIKEMARTCKRGLHGIDFGSKDDGFDKTHCTLKSKGWWQALFAAHAPGWPVEIVDKEELEAGPFPEEFLIDPKNNVKLNIGSYTTMAHMGWINLDVHPLEQWAAGYRYNFQRCDVRQGLPYGTGAVDLIAAHHMLEHLTFDEGRRFLKECRRVLKPESGAMRIAVPDAKFLTERYLGKALGEFDEINDGCAKAPTSAGKLWALLHEGHSAAYDIETLCAVLEDAGFRALGAAFRQNHPAIFATKQIVQETIEMDYGGLSLFVDAVPHLG